MKFIKEDGYFFREEPGDPKLIHICERHDELPSEALPDLLSVFVGKQPKLVTQMQPQYCLKIGNRMEETYRLWYHLNAETEITNSWCLSQVLRNKR